LGIQGLELKWFESYLSDRKQFVHNNGVSSNLLCILLGVPQGSILGPLLFLIYINDLPDCSKLCAYLFADDTTLLAKNANLNKLFSDVNEEFRKVVYYFRAHRLVLHPDKTTFMLFSTANADTVNNKIYIDNNNYAEAHYNPDIKSAIHCVNNLDASKVKFLGVLIDPNLNFCFHIKAIFSQLLLVRRAERSERTPLSAAVWRGTPPLLRPGVGDVTPPILRSMADFYCGVAAIRDR
jgi:hypothetical protein